jgi:dihydrolipoamide dehydrogenase
VLAKAARLVRDGEQLGHYGLIGERPAVDFPRLLERTQALVDQIHDKKRLEQHLERAGVTRFEGAARFVDDHTLVLDGGTALQGDKFIICAGGRARRLPFPGGELALTHSDVWSLPKLPRSVAIVGGAATGCQLASVFAAFGSEVWLLDLAPRILPGEDELVSQVITDAFARRKIEIVSGIGGVERLERDGEGIRFHYMHHGEGRMLPVEAVILAVGWPGNVDTLNLAAANVQTERSYIVVDDHLRTSTPHIFAAGDITGRMMLVQSATFEARIAAENAVRDAGLTFPHQIVPHGGFTDPEYGSVGLTEQQARAYHDYCSVEVNYAELDRAVIDGRTEGFCKLIVSRTSHQIVGAHVVGEQAVEVVQMIAAGMAAGTRVEHLAHLELAYPTFTGIVGLAARQVVRELGIIALAPEWRSLEDPRGVEWERREQA